MVARGLHLYDRCGKGVLAEHPHDEGVREQIHCKPERLQRKRNAGGLRAPVQPIATSQISATTTNVSMNFLSAAGWSA